MVNLLTYSHQAVGLVINESFVFHEITILIHVVSDPMN